MHPIYLALGLAAALASCLALYEALLRGRRRLRRFRVVRSRRGRDQELLETWDRSRRGEFLLALRLAADGGDMIAALTLMGDTVSHSVITRGRAVGRTLALSEAQAEVVRIGGRR